MKLIYFCIYYLYCTEALVNCSFPYNQSEGQMLLSLKKETKMHQKNIYHKHCDTDNIIVLVWHVNMCYTRFDIKNTTLVFHST